MLSQEVQEMFGKIARRYDRANSILSLGVHASWRRKAIRMSGASEGQQILDVACGTGDLTFGFEKIAGLGQVRGLDYTREMLEVATVKAAKKKSGATFEQGDCQALPFADNSFDIASISFGIRNVDDPAKGVADLCRVVRPGGRVIVLEFGQPKGLWGKLYQFYSKKIMPVIGGRVTGERAAYEYLPRTAANFPAGDEFVDLMGNAAEFDSILAIPLTGGIAWVYVGIKAVK